MKSKYLLIMSLLMLAGCNSDTGSQETQLISKDNRHILYLFTDSMKAEVYSGMSVLGKFEMSYTADNTYTLTPESGKYTELVFINNPEKNNWVCKNCKGQGLDSRWLEQ
jgi:hypothetical protein